MRCCECEGGCDDVWKLLTPSVLLLLQAALVSPAPRCTARLTRNKNCALKSRESRKLMQPVKSAGSPPYNQLVPTLPRMSPAHVTPLATSSGPSHASGPREQELVLTAMGSRNCEILFRGKATGHCRVFAPGLPIADIPVLNQELVSHPRRSRWRDVLGTRAGRESFHVTHNSEHARSRK
jgi:hypothetical protein